MRTAIQNRTSIGINLPVDIQELDWDPWNDNIDTTLEGRTLDFTGDIGLYAAECG